MTELFRVSFSVLDPWSRGDYDEAVKRYMKIATPPTPAMEDGKMLHEQWHTETMKTKSLPKVFGGRLLKDAVPEIKMECIIDGWIQFVGIVDNLEADTIHEYKTGHADSNTYTRTMQTKCYHVLTKLNGYDPKQAMIHHFNQHTKRVTRSKIWLTDYTFEQGKNWIITYASELHEALKGSGQL